MLAWVYLILAGVLEIAWASALKLSDGFTKLWPTLIIISLMLPSFFLLGQASRHIPIGTAYATWTGIGAAGVALVGMFWFNEPATLIRFLCIGGIIVCIVVLKLTSSPS